MSFEDVFQYEYGTFERGFRIEEWKEMMERRRGSVGLTN
jgi:hypothetical protein